MPKKELTPWNTQPPSLRHIFGVHRGNRPRADLARQQTDRPAEKHPDRQDQQRRRSQQISPDPRRRQSIAFELRHSSGVRIDLLPGGGEPLNRQFLETLAQPVRETDL